MAKAATTKKAKEASTVKSPEDLKNDLDKKQAEILETRRSHRAGELVNPRALTHARKEIARLKTSIRAHELNEVKGDK